MFNKIENYYVRIYQEKVHISNLSDYFILKHITEETISPNNITETLYLAHPDNQTHYLKIHNDYVSRHISHDMVLSVNNEMSDMFKTFQQWNLYQKLQQDLPNNNQVKSHKIKI